MTRWLALPLWLTGVLIFSCGVARASVDGSVPSPGGCDYPAVGTFGAAFGEYDYACQFPVEENGSRHTTLFGGGMWQVNVTAGVAFMMFNASVGVTSPMGVLRGITYWACPDLSMSDAPRPPGAWKNADMKSKPCKTIAPVPQLLRDGMPAPPAGAPAPPDPPAPIVQPPPDPNPQQGTEPPAPLLPTQTNPGATQPFQPEEHP